MLVLVAAALVNITAAVCALLQSRRHLAWCHQAQCTGVICGRAIRRVPVFLNQSGHYVHLHNTVWCLF